MKRVTAAQVKREIERNEKRWLKFRDEILPTKDDPIEKEIAYLCSRWFVEQLRKHGDSVGHIDMARAYNVRLVAELSRCLGCSHGKKKLAIRVTVDAWNNYVEDMECKEEQLKRSKRILRKTSKGG